MSDFIFTIISTAVSEETHEIACQIKCIGELVRCKDCVYYNKLNKCSMLAEKRNKNDYCSYGEKGEVNEL